MNTTIIPAPILKRTVSPGRTASFSVAGGLKALVRWSVIASFALAAGLCLAEPRMTAFHPEKNGFKFVNRFENDFVPVLDIHTGGLCGGMTYAALDYYFTGAGVPVQPFAPANGTPLYNYLYDRQVSSIKDNVDKWGEIGFNPNGARDSEFFKWGLQATHGGRIEELKSFIDAGKPCPLGLQGNGKTGNHQVIAFGYDMGRYTGDLTGHMEEFKIYICDPNYPGQRKTLVPDVAAKLYKYDDGGNERWRTYFVDKNYHTKQAPEIRNGHYPNDGLVHELALDFATSGDDLRGGQDNVNLTLNLKDGTQQVYNNLNLGKRWINNSRNCAEVALRNPLAYDQINSAVLATTFTGGIGGDNWDMKSLDIYTWGGDFREVVTNHPGKRFTGESKVLTITLNPIVTGPGQVDRLSLAIRTGGDDLRGVNDNVNVTIRFRDGKSQIVPDANAGRPWAKNTTHTVEIPLSRAVLPGEIQGLELSTTFSGGIGGDNWDMQGIHVQALGNGVNQSLADHGFKRFTGSDRSISIPITIAAAGQASQLEFTFKTGGDDLRGGHDNVNALIRFRDGHTQPANNLNGGGKWANQSTHAVTVTLNQAVNPMDITGLTLQTTFSGGIGGDNWNLESVSVHALGNGLNSLVFSSGAKRFTGDSRTLELTRR